MCVICVQGIADAQEELQDLSTPVWRRDLLGRSVQRYERYIQTYQQDIRRYDLAIEEQRSAFRGESCPKGNRS